MGLAPFQSAAIAPPFTQFSYPLAASIATSLLFDEIFWLAPGPVRTSDSPHPPRGAANGTRGATIP